MADLGVSWLEQDQRSDGSWGETEDIRPLYTAEVVRAFKALNRRSPAYFRGITWLENHATTNADYIARRILALAPHGDDLSRDVAFLESAQAPGDPVFRGFGLTPAYMGAPLDTAIVLQALAVVPPSDQEVIDDALSFLIATQIVGDGWALGSGASSDAITTANVLRALLPHRTDPLLLDPINGAVAMLEVAVGTTSPALVQASAALALLDESDGTSAHAHLLLESLADSQSSAYPLEGSSWGQNAYTTAIAVHAFAKALGTDSIGSGATVLVADVGLRSAINLALGKNALDAISVAEMQELRKFDASGYGIADLTGLEEAIELREIDLSNNALTSADIAALSALTDFDLTKLVHVTLEGNPADEQYDSLDVSNDPDSPSVGTVVLDPDPDFANQYLRGVLVEARATALTGRVFGGWSDDASGVETPIEIFVDRNLRITAHFPPIPGTVSREQTKCIKKLNKDLGKVADTVAREISSCIRNGAKGVLETTIEACLVGDSRGRIQKALNRTLSDYERFCIIEPPSIGARNAAAVNPAGKQMGIDLVHDVLGLDLDSTVATYALDQDMAKCQGRVVRSTYRCAKDRLKEFYKCKVAALKGSSVGEEDLAECLNVDPKGKIAKVCDPTLGTISRRILPTRCLTPGVPLDVAFPGCDTPDSFELTTCIDERVRCRACLAIQQADELDNSWLDCDLFDDDDTSNGSCTLAN